MNRIFLFVLSVSTVWSMNAQNSLPRVFLLDAATISRVRESIRAGNTEFTLALQKLKKDAEKALKQVPISVMDKKQTPPTGDKHDYMSLAPYWWPDPQKPDGLPYIRRDGEVNPERAECTDRDNIRTLVSSVYTLSLAYYLTENESYAKHAVAMMRVWFLNIDTRMNPNLNFGQAVKGRNEGRGAGLIEASGFRNIVDAIGLLEGSEAWTASDRRGMEKWFDEYFVWLRSSNVGLDEWDSKNNHGTWYDVQAAAIAFFLGKNDTAYTILIDGKRRIASQIEPDGRMPLELVRTKALGYTTMNLDAFFSLATLAKRVGIDLWNFETGDGRSLRRALDWVFPYWSEGKSWPYKQIIPFDREESYPLLAQAATQFKEKKFVQAAKTIPSADRSRILYGTK